MEESKDWVLAFFKKQNQELKELNLETLVFIRNLLANLENLEEQREIVFSRKAKKTLAAIIEEFVKK